MTHACMFTHDHNNYNITGKLLLGHVHSYNHDADFPNIYHVCCMCIDIVRIPPITIPIFINPVVQVLTL